VYIVSTLNLLNINSNICAVAIFAVVDTQTVLRNTMCVHLNDLSISKRSLITIISAVKENIRKVARLLF
jgi:hypothetical protein